MTDYSNIKELWGGNPSYYHMNLLIFTHYILVFEDVIFQFIYYFIYFIFFPSTYFYKSI